MSDIPKASDEAATAKLAQLQLETQQVLGYLADEFGKQLKFANHELTQTQGLLNDAVNTLTACFTVIHDTVRVGRTCHDSNPITHDIAAHAGAPQEDKRELQEVESEGGEEGELETLMNTAIRTLQFQDLTQQLIDHALHRIAAMREVMNDLKSMSSADGQDQMAFLEMLHHQRASIERNVATLDEHKTNPVSQGHMMTGEIELF